ncbi:Uncharacterised protein [uncultured archaeon]|nr:Uncharacterised protein [uncultured archaeon]
MIQWLKSKWQDERVQFAAYLAGYFGFISAVPSAMKVAGIWAWFIWPFILLAQNFAFTFVSRARSSASIMRHAKASLMSNGIWIVSQIVLLGPMYDYLTGRHGIKLQMLAEMVYTISTMSGSLYAHFYALKTEKGKNAVGASKLYAQVPTAQWEAVKAKLGIQ